MAFDHRPGIRLGGATKKEESREEVLRKAKEERAARQGAKRQAKGALTAQRLWRGHTARRRLRAQLLGLWVGDFSSAAADTSVLLPAAVVHTRALPPVLLAFLPPLFSPRRRAVEAGEPLHLSSSTDVTALRGSLALLLRSLTSPEESSNYTAIFRVSQGAETAWRSQARRLCLLCAALLGASGAADALIQTAAARVLAVLTDPTAWRWAPTAEGDDSTGVRRISLSLNTSLESSAAVHVCAARMVSSASMAKQSSQQGAGPSEAIVQATVAAAFSICPSEAAGGTFLCNHLLPVPGLCSGLPLASRAKLTSGGILMAAALALERSQASTNLHSAANLSQLVAGGCSIQPAQPLPEANILKEHGSGLAKPYLMALTRVLQQQLSGGHCGDVKQAMRGLWPLAERSHALQLLQVMGHDGLPVVLEAYCLLLAKQWKSVLGAEAGKLQMPFLNCLAFAPSVLPKLWAWLARLIGLPLEAPAGATSGWNISSLRAGVAGLPAQQAAYLGVFCRLLAHLLLVVDDDDFHNHQDPFPLSVSRGVATALNTLVFCTHVPDPAAAKKAPKSTAGAGASGGSLLAEWAPVVLRSLYERDLRRPFCPSSLWLAPYAAVTQEDTAEKLSSLLLPFGARPPPKAANFSAPAVVRALTNMTGDGPRAQAHPSTSAPSPVADRKLGASPHQLAALLLAAPHCIPFAQRVEVFRALVATDREHGAGERQGALRLKVRRQALLDDAFQQLGRAGSGVKARLEVTFVNEQGLQEAGLDYGGLMKDFIEDVIKAGFNPDYGLFTATNAGEFFPGAQAVHMEQGVGLLQFLGLMLGKSMYEGMLMDLPLAPFFVLRLQGRRPLFDELQLLDEDIYRSLVSVKHFEVWGLAGLVVKSIAIGPSSGTADSVYWLRHNEKGDCEVMGLDFTVEEEAFGSRQEIELISDGASVPVTNANKLQYVALVADWHLNGGSRGTAASAFAWGLGQVIPLSWLNLFSPKELNEVIGGGAAGDIDMEDMKAHTKYSGGYTASCSTVKLFWKAVEGMPPADRAALLKFVTSCSRAPLGGFAFMNPPFTVHKVPCSAPLLAVVGGKDVHRIPSASTCFNTLKLPNFRRLTTMKEKLLYAIHSGAGFELS